MCLWLASIPNENEAKIPYTFQRWLANVGNCFAPPGRCPPNQPSSMYMSSSFQFMMLHSVRSTHKMHRKVHLLPKSQVLRICLIIKQVPVPHLPTIYPSPRLGRRAAAVPPSAPRRLLASSWPSRSFVAPRPWSPGTDALSRDASGGEVVCSEAGCAFRR